MTTGTVTLNGREIERAAEFEKLYNGELNWLLGEGGSPKYSDGEMKNRTKQQLADELRTLVASIPEQKSKPRTSGVGRGNARPPSVSKTKAVAQSKKCNLIKALVAGKTTPDHIREVLAVDVVLADYWKTADADIEAAQHGVRPKDQPKQTIEQVEADSAGDVATETDEVLEAEPA